MSKNITILTCMLLCSLGISAQIAEAWITAPSSNKLLEQQAPQTVSAASPAAQCITVDPSQEYQGVDGFGWMLSEGSAKLLMTMSAADRQAILKEIYSVEEGLGVTMVRLAIGASDLSESDYTYSPSQDLTLSNFSLEGPDLQYVIPVLKEILAIHPEVKVLATPWTAPIWMKTNNGYVGGELKVEYYGTYADYFVKYLRAMQAEGINVWGVTPQNEPLHDGNNPSMKMTQDVQYRFIENYLGPQLKAAGYGHVKILCYDHNCDVMAYPVFVAKSQYVSGSAFHLYGGEISALTTVHDRTGKDVYFTEQYTGANGDFGGDFTWHMQNVMLGSVNNWSRCAIEWNLASDPNNQPHTQGGCTDCKGALTISNGRVTSRNVSYYIVGQMSRVVRMGAKRIGSSGASDFQYAAFHNPDGSLAVVARNKTGNQKQVSIKLGTDVVTYTVPGNSALSVLIPTMLNPFETALQPVPVERAVLDPNAPMFDILGQPVGGSYRGLVIQNGRKFIKQ